MEQIHRRNGNIIYPIHKINIETSSIGLVFRWIAVGLLVRLLPLLLGSSAWLLRGRSWPGLVAPSLRYFGQIVEIGLVTCSLQWRFGFVFDEFSHSCPQQLAVLQIVVTDVRDPKRRDCCFAVLVKRLSVFDCKWQIGLRSIELTWHHVVFNSVNDQKRALNLVDLETIDYPTKSNSRMKLSWICPCGKLSSAYCKADSPDSSIHVSNKELGQLKQEAQTRSLHSRRVPSVKKGILSRRSQCWSPTKWCSHRRCSKSCACTCRQIRRRNTDWTRWRDPMKCHNRSSRKQWCRSWETQRCLLGMARQLGDRWCRSRLDERTEECSEPSVVETWCKRSQESFRSSSRPQNSQCQSFRKSTRDQSQNAIDFRWKLSTTCLPFSIG